MLKRKRNIASPGLDVIVKETFGHPWADDPRGTQYDEVVLRRDIYDELVSTCEHNASRNMVQGPYRLSEDMAPSGSCTVDVNIHAGPYDRPCYPIVQIDGVGRCHPIDPAHAWELRHAVQKTSCIPLTNGVRVTLVKTVEWTDRQNGTLRLCISGSHLPAHVAIFPAHSDDGRCTHRFAALPSVVLILHAIRNMASLSTAETRDKVSDLASACLHKCVVGISRPPWMEAATWQAWTERIVQKGVLPTCNHLPPSIQNSMYESMALGIGAALLDDAMAKPMLQRIQSMDKRAADAMLHAVEALRKHADVDIHHMLGLEHATHTTGVWIKAARSLLHHLESIAQACMATAIACLSGGDEVGKPAASLEVPHSTGIKMVAPQHCLLPPTEEHVTERPYSLRMQTFLHDQVAFALTNADGTLVTKMSCMELDALRIAMIENHERDRRCNVAGSKIGVYVWSSQPVVLKQHTHTPVVASPPPFPLHPGEFTLLTVEGSWLEHPGRWGACVEKVAMWAAAVGIEKAVHTMAGASQLVQDLMREYQWNARRIGSTVAVSICHTAMLNRRSRPPKCTSCSSLARKLGRPHIFYPAAWELDETPLCNRHKVKGAVALVPGKACATCIAPYMATHSDWCRQHKPAGTMYAPQNKLCVECTSVKIAKWSPLKCETPSLCHQCSLSRVDYVDRLCAECQMFLATHGYPNHDRTRCCTHAAKGMIQPWGTCQHVYCERVPSFGFVSVHQFCALHSHKDMFDFTHALPLADVHVVDRCGEKSTPVATPSPQVHFATEAIEPILRPFIAISDPFGSVIQIVDERTSALTYRRPGYCTVPYCFRPFYLGEQTCVFHAARVVVS